MSKLIAGLVTAASAGTALLAWAFTQNPLFGLTSGGIAGGRLIFDLLLDTIQLVR